MGPLMQKEKALQGKQAFSDERGRSCTRDSFLQVRSAKQKETHPRPNRPLLRTEDASVKTYEDHFVNGMLCSVM